MQSWPDAVPFDPAVGARSPVLEALVRGPAAALSAVLLIVGERARSSGFGAAAAIAIADAWSAGDRVPVLTDLDLENPSLHESLGVPNDEGVADAFAFGTSLRMLWRALDDRRFSFLAAGYATDPGEVVGAGDWRRIIAQESATGHTLLLYVPANATGVDALAGKVGAVIVLAEPEDLPEAAASLPRPYAIVAVLTPYRDQSIVHQSSIDTGNAESDAEPGPRTEPMAEARTEARAEVRRDDEHAASEVQAPARAEPPLIVDDRSEALRAEADNAEAERAEADNAARSRAEAGRAEADRAEKGASSFSEPVTEADYDRIRVPREGAGREQLIADLRARQRAAMLAPPSDAAAADGPGVGARREAAGGESPRVARESTPTGSLPGEPPRLEPGSAVLPRRTASGQTASRRQVFMLVGMVAVVVAVAGWYLFLRPKAAPPPVVHTAAPAVVVDSLAMVSLPFVVAIEAYTELQTAEERQVALSGAETGMHFFVAPLVRANVPYYHVFAGPLRDSASGAAVLDTLLAHKVKTGAIPGDVRQVPLSFMVGSYNSRSDAMSRVEELRRMAVPTFVVSGDVDGVTEWHVYAGAYGGPAEADVMRQMLKAAGVKDSLVTRMGRSNQ